jgi:hypothetical protein
MYETTPGRSSSGKKPSKFAVGTMHNTRKGQCEVIARLGGTRVMVRFVESGNEREASTNNLKSGYVADTTIVGKGGPKPSRFAVGTRHNTPHGICEVIQRLGGARVVIRFDNTGSEREVSSNNLGVGNVADLIRNGVDEAAIKRALARLFPNGKWAKELAKAP